MKLLLVSAALTACATTTPRQTIMSPPDPAKAPYRAFLAADCAGNHVEAAGVLTCEDQVHDFAVLTKVPAGVPGRVVTAGDDWRDVIDFGVDGEPDDFVSVDGRFNYEDHPNEQVVELRIAAAAPQGTVGVKGLVYRHTCSWPDSPCGALVVKSICEGIPDSFAAGEIGVCQRPTGTSQRLGVDTPEGAVGAKLLVAATRMGVEAAYTTVDPDGVIWFDLPKTPEGPTVVSMRMVWDDAGTKMRRSGRFIVSGYSPDWMPIDQPHFRGEHAFAPVGADLFEVTEIGDGGVTTRTTTNNGGAVKVDPAKDACGWAWTVGSMDLTYACKDPPPRGEKL